ncbi:unnamed protein product [Adineta ricciae]|uniref:Uncharacterized protein n=1 Tax=Adineta ricciae TaxID=249248 RepID=A0A814U4A4_ADIRI|nr:unnamed protein product [Adineta ricciae]
MRDHYDMSNIEDLEDTQEPDGADMDLNDESMELTRLREGEELLKDPVNEEAMDSWSKDVIESDVGLVPGQETLSSIIPLYFDNELRKLNIRRNSCYDVKSRWNTLHQVLKPFHNATTVMCDRDYPSIGRGLYFLAHLKIFLQQRRKKEPSMMKRFKQLLLAQFVVYFENDTEQVQLLKFHSYFDAARFSALTDPEKRGIEQTIKMMAMNEPYVAQPVVSQSPDTTTISLSQKIGTPKKEKMSTLDVFNESIDESIYDSIPEHDPRDYHKKSNNYR